MSFVCRIASAGFHASTAGGRRGGDRTSCVCGAPGPGVTRSCRPWRAACGLGCAVPGAGGGALRRRGRSDLRDGLDRMRLSGRVAAHTCAARGDGDATCADCA